MITYGYFKDGGTFVDVAASAEAAKRAARKNGSTEMGYRRGSWPTLLYCWDDHTMSWISPQVRDLRALHEAMSMVTYDMVMGMRPEDSIFLDSKGRYELYHYMNDDMLVFRDNVMDEELYCIQHSTEERTVSFEVI